MLNVEMARLNSLIFGENKNSPAIHFESTKSYTFSTFDDHGTGTNNKGLIMFDLASLNLTELPLLIHDSFLFKNIGKDTKVNDVSFFYIFDSPLKGLSLAQDIDYDRDIRAGYFRYLVNLEISDQIKLSSQFLWYRKMCKMLQMIKI